ncbi:MAG TPA: ABC transporter permease subunit [Anaerolineaceae bacterium]|nr:ABC transporter permease subunit [Anaerolineaceae bacterium]
MDRIQTIIGKEWAEVFKNRLVLFTVTLLPILLTAMPLLVLNSTKGTSIPGPNTTDLTATFGSVCAGIPVQDCMQVYLANEFLLLFMILPVMIPITIAAYSIVGEKTTHSLEPLLATPITTFELLAGKTLAAVIPAIVATWGCFFIFILLLPVVGVSKAVISYITGPTWMLAVLIIGPLMAVLAVNFAVIISSRVNDPRVAEQFSVVLLLPILIVLFGQIAGIVSVNLQLVLIAIVAFILIDIGGIYLGSTLFQRETILTRWR